MMKWIDSQAISNANQMLSAICDRRPTLHAKLEVFCVDKVGNSTKKSYSLPTQSAMDVGSNFVSNPSPRHFSILANAFGYSFPDFDTSSLEFCDFKRVSCLDEIKNNISWQLNSPDVSSDVMDAYVWQGIDNEIFPPSCDIYKYEPAHIDLFSQLHTLWNYTYFFINEKQKKALVLHLRESSSEEDEFSEEEEGELFGFCVF